MTNNQPTPTISHTGRNVFDFSVFATDLASKTNWCRKGNVRDTLNSDQMIIEGGWSDLRQFREPTEIDLERLEQWRLGRLREQMKLHDVAALVWVNSISLRYAVNYATYIPFQSRIQST